MSALRSRAHAALPLASWPAADRAAWAAAHRQGDFLQKDGHATTWRAATERSALGAYGRWLRWSADQGVELSREEPSARLTPDRVHAYVAYLQQDRAPVTVASVLGVMCMVVVALFPEQDWSWLRAVQRRARRRARPVRNKEARVVPATDLFNHGLALMAQADEALERPEAEAPQLPDRQRVAAARDYRDGLIIAVQATIALRVKNLLSIELGRHLRIAHGRATLYFPASEMKTHQAHETDWPASLVSHLDRYLSTVRPILVAAPAPGGCGRYARPPGARLWVGQGGSPLTPAGVQKALARHTRLRFGHALNPHLFRDCLATTQAALDPKHGRYASALLGHGNTRTTERSYIIASQQVALDHHHRVIDAMRKAARAKARSLSRPRALVGAPPRRRTDP
ncbi:hypothetical protein GXW78_08175 [Roseomonas terrae]|uniref:Tyr recombinase domain-containing protein n=1 Tax=Neoroseomonas terrae TaxID=424799 RepID=A0ABS5EF34_9PROT|nr:hypothetical protein [Neoroseomonas terrae]MBR0649634.1 hypothetical protein [Neoroseomonas terrae]